MVVTGAVDNDLYIGLYDEYEEFHYDSKTASTVGTLIPWLQKAHLWSAQETALGKDLSIVVDLFKGEETFCHACVGAGSANFWIFQNPKLSSKLSALGSVN